MNPIIGKSCSWYTATGKCQGVICAAALADDGRWLLLVLDDRGLLVTLEAAHVTVDVDAS